MIAITETTRANLAAAYATPDPKHIWIDGERIVVYTGRDIPPTPVPEPAMVAEPVAIKAIRLADTRMTEIQAKATLETARTTVEVAARL